MVSIKEVKYFYPPKETSYIKVEKYNLCNLDGRIMILSFLGSYCGCEFGQYCKIKIWDNYDLR